MNITNKDGISNTEEKNNEEPEQNKPTQSTKDELITTIKEWIKMDIYDHYLYDNTINKLLTYHFLFQDLYLYLLFLLINMYIP